MKNYLKIKVLSFLLATVVMSTALAIDTVTNKLLKNSKFSSPISKEMYIDSNRDLSIVRLSYDNLFNSKQTISIATIDVKKNNWDVYIEIAPEGKLLTTTALMKTNNADLAINGGFFSWGPPVVPVGLLQKDGKVISPARVSKIHGVVAITEKNRIEVVPLSEFDNKKYKDAVCGRPMLLKKGQVQSYPKSSFFTARHPRTIVGTTKDGSIIVIAIDGRSAKAKGMNTEEMLTFCKALELEDAVNIDGGGSTTMSAKSNPFGQNVVNYVSNKNGVVRAVKDAICFRKK